MCLIIHKPTANLAIPETYIDNAETINPDGFGIVYTDTNECVRTMDYELARKLIEAPRPFVAHYRYATRGKIKKENCHPYHVNNLTRLFSNGTVADLGDDILCDTAVVANTLKRMPDEYWNDLLSMTDTRFAITHPNGDVERHGTWHEKDGIYYSKNNCFYTTKSSIGYHYNWNKSSTTSTNYWSNTQSKPKDNTVYGYNDDLYDNWDDYDEYKMYNDSNISDWKDIHKVAVYGTLKAGRGNHRLLANAQYQGAGLTVNKYTMQTQGVPYVFRDVHRDQITVEVYDVPGEACRESLDILEGHPNHYERELIDVELLDGSVVTCWLYFGNPIYYDVNMKHISSY